jgi:P4 family phage/plasmid primase-like protien
MVRNAKMTTTIPVADIYALVEKDPSSIIDVPIESIEIKLNERTDLYEITWKHSDADKCRAYIDVDGCMVADTDEADFQTMNEAIRNVLSTADLGSPFSILMASKYNNKDWKSKERKHKLSFRLTFTHVCGSKEAVKTWTRDVVCPKLKLALSNTIGFYIKGVDKIPDDMDYVDWDNAVYRSHGKMRCWNSTKPGEGRKNVLVKGSVVDTLINYIPTDCVVLPEPAAPVRVERITMPTAAVETASPSPTPNGELKGEKALLQRIMEGLPVSVGDSYNEWISVGMACFNEELPLEVWDSWSSKSSKYRSGECERKWRSFKKGNISQAYLWSLLKKHNPTLFKELIGERRDFPKLVENPTQYAMAEYFYNMRPNDYLYDTNSGWFGVLPSNVWENPNGKANPPTLKNKIVRVLNAERLQLEGVLLAKKTKAMEDGTTEVIESLDKLTKKCLDFREKIESDGFQRGMIKFLESFYAEQGQRVMAGKGVKEQDGVVGVFDTNPNIFAFTDCCYDFTIKDFRSIEPTDYITITCGYMRPHANNTVRGLIMETLTGIWEDMGVRDYMLTLLASCLCGVRNLEVFTIMTGRGGNGKGLLWELVMRVFGGYYYQLPVAVLTKKADSAHGPTPDVAKMRGMRCIGTSEPEAEERLQEGTIKLYTGGDPITGRLLQQQPITFKPQFGIFIQCNIIPMFNQSTKAGVRRNRVVPFPFNFVANPKLPYERAGNPHIKNVLCRSDEWRDEFFYILLSYYSRAEGKQIDGIPTPKLVRERTEEYVADNNRVGAWWEEHYEKHEGSFVSSREALEALRADIGIRMSEREFKAALAFNDIDIVKITAGPLKGRMGVSEYRRIPPPGGDDEN